MAADVTKLLKKEPNNVLLPDDFEQHVHPEILDIGVFYDGKSVSMLNVSEDSVHSVLEEKNVTSFTAAKSILAL